VKWFNTNKKAPFFFRLLSVDQGDDVSFHFRAIREKATAHSRRSSEWSLSGDLGIQGLHAETSLFF